MPSCSSLKNTGTDLIGPNIFSESYSSAATLGLVCSLFTFYIMDVHEIASCTPSFVGPFLHDTVAYKARRGSQAKLQAFVSSTYNSILRKVYETSWPVGEARFCVSKITWEYYTKVWVSFYKIWLIDGPKNTIRSLS